MTYRAVRILSETELIAAEDTRRTRKLLAHFDIHTPLTSYHEHNKFDKGPRLIEWLLAGHDLVCVSDAGLPGIADPGSHLAQMAIEAGIPVSPLPGANAALSALICSGLDTVRFSFLGFLPHTAEKRRKVLEGVKEREDTLLFYEAPHHLQATLTELVQILGGERQAAAARELTKKFEEFRRGTLSELAAYFKEHAPRGEFVLIVAGCREGIGDEKNEAEALPPAELAAKLMEEGLPKKEAMRETAKRLGISRRDVYKAMLVTAM